MKLMFMLLKKCISCKEYGFSEKCRKCESATKNPHPQKFSLIKKYEKYMKRM
jgi:rRNA maturation protein Nop10